MKKAFFVLLILLSLIPSSATAAETIFSNQVSTKVGSPTTPNPLLSIHPKPPNTPVDLRQAIIDRFGITMNGFENKQLAWAWEKFWDISNTKYMPLVNGTILNAQPGAFSAQLGCKAVRFGRDLDENSFKITLVHEMGHVIYWCSTDSENKHTEQGNILAQEGGVTGYAASPCYGTSAITEDYAEMLAYYLNPGLKEITPCNNRNQIPYGNGRYLLHFNLAKIILGQY